MYYTKTNSYTRGQVKNVMARLPQPGGDSGNWGTILNDYLSQSHQADGTLKQTAVSNAGALLKDVADNRYVRYIAPSGDSSGATDTATIQTALNTAINGSMVILTQGTFYIGNITITNKIDFKLEGYGARINLVGDGTANGGLGIQLVGTVNNVEVSGLHIIGDGVKAHQQKGIWSSSGQTITDLRVHHNTIEQVIVGISANANLGGSIDGFEFTHNVLRNIIGVSSGQGYGLHVAYINATSSRGKIAHNRIYYAGRHSIYCARGCDVDIYDNQIIGHRSALTADEIADVSDGRGKVRPALLVARSKHITIKGNTFVGGYDCALQLNANPNNEAGVSLYDIHVLGNHFRQPQDIIPMMIIGDPTPSIASYPYDIVIEGNDFWADFGELSGVNSVDQMRHNCGKNVRYVTNTVTIRGVNNSHAGADVRFAGESAGGNAYNDEIVYDSNKFHLVTTNGSTCRGIHLDDTVGTAGGWITVKDTEAGGNAASQPAVFTSPYTNSNARLYNRTREAAGVYVAGDTTPSVARGLNYLEIANPTPVSITNFTGGEEGQRLVLRFLDTRTTLVESSLIRLRRQSNWTSNNRDILMLVYKAGTWFEERTSWRQDGTVLGRVAYAPASRVSYTTSSTTLVAVDSTNLTVSFVAPLSGKVIVRANVLTYLTSGSYLIAIGLLDHSTSAQVGGIQTATASVSASHQVAEVDVTGLTPGTTYQYDLAWAVSNASAVGNIQAGIASSVAQTAAPASVSIVAN